MNLAERQRPAPGEQFLDHVAHFVPDLDAAAELLEKLGFAPTPVSHHEVSGKPAGTANRCLMLEQGYIEILAPTLDTPNAARVRERMKSFVGVHLACFGTPAAEAEHARLTAHGFEPEPLIALERKTQEGGLRFKVVYSPPGKMPEGRVQYCEHLTPQTLWSQRSLRHGNGVTGLVAVYVVADDVAQTAARWARFSAALPLFESDHAYLETARGRIYIAKRETLSRFLDHVPPPPALAGYALATKNGRSFARRCKQAGLEVREAGQGYSVSLPPALGGAWYFCK